MLTAFLYLAGCASGVRPPSESGEKVTVADDLGRKVVLPQKVSRIVSLAPNLTEIIFAIGAGEDLYGVTTFCNYPEEAKRIRRVGDTLKPNIESIIALRPDVVFVSTASQLEGFVNILKSRGISVFVTNPGSVEEVFESIGKIGLALGREKRARALVEELRSRFAAVEERTKGRRKPRVFVQLDGSLYTIGKDSYLTELVESAGGRSVTSDVATAYPKISRERARALDPEAIVISVSPDNDEPNGVFKESRAVKNGRIIRIDADLLSRPGPRIAEALELLARGLDRR